MFVFVQKITFIRRKIHKKTVATRTALFGSNMHQIVCRLGRASPQTPLGELTALSRPLAVFRGLLLRWEGERGEGRRGEERGWEGGNGKEEMGRREGEGVPPLP